MIKLYTLFLMSVSTHFIFPMMVLIIMGNETNKNFAAGLISFALITNVLTLPIIGRKLDSGYSKSILSISAIAICVGTVLLNYFKSDFLTITGVLLFVNGTSYTYSAARRLIEGYAKFRDIKNATQNTYLVENLGAGISAAIAFYFFDSYKIQLIMIDCLFTTLFAIYLMNYKIDESSSKKGARKKT